MNQEVDYIFEEIRKGKTLNLLGLIAKITSPFFLAFFIAKWFYIFQGIDYDPLDKLENKALEYFKKNPLFKIGGEK